MSMQISKLEAYARCAHGDQKYGGLGYHHHLSSVSGLAYSVLPTFEVYAGGWLHDVVEDTDRTIDDVGSTFGPEVASIVSLCTDPEGDTRRIRKRLLHERLSLSDNICGLVVKLSDRLANALSSRLSSPSLLSMYRREHVEFREAAYRDHPSMSGIQCILDEMLS